MKHILKEGEINEKKYSFYPYDSEYPSLFKKQRKILRKVIGKSSKIEHVGSTSVPRLGGKGIIDIAIKTPRNKLNQFTRKLERIGYEHNSEHPANDKRIFLQKKIIYKKKERRIHIHLVPDNDFWDSFIVVRDYLRNHDTERDKYAKIKKEAVKHAEGKGKKYREYKDKFLEELTKKALKRRLNINKIKEH